MTNGKGRLGVWFAQFTQCYCFVSVQIEWANCSLRWAIYWLRRRMIWEWNWQRRIKMLWVPIIHYLFLSGNKCWLIVRTLLNTITWPILVSNWQVVECFTARLEFHSRELAIVSSHFLALSTLSICPLPSAAGFEEEEWDSKRDESGIGFIPIIILLLPLPSFGPTRRFHCKGPPSERERERINYRYPLYSIP